MQILSNTTKFQLPDKTAAAIGKFDGVHLGHQSLLKEILSAREDGLKPAVFTFDPAPEEFFGRHRIPQLSTKEEKRDLFSDLGIDYLIEFPFDETTASMPPEQFVREILSERMQAKVIAAGPDLSFGDRGRGNFALLEAMSRECGYETRLISKMQYEGQEISSTLIRQFVTEGKMERAAACLGSPYSVTGIVTHGNALGRTIGFPTLNLYPDGGKLLPPFGVYYSLVTVFGDDGSRTMYEGMTDIGEKPTVKEKKKRVSVETFVYDFTGDLYGKKIRVDLLTFERPEIKFASFQKLQRRIQADVEAGRQFFQKRRAANGI